MAFAGAVLGALGGVSGATAAVPLPATAVAIRPATASPESARVVLQTAGDTVDVRVPGRPVRHLSVPGCGLIARPSPRTGFCAVVAPSDSAGIVDLASGVRSTVATTQIGATGRFLAGFEAAGSRWLAGIARGVGATRLVLVSRDGRTVVGLGRPLLVGARSVLDLDRAGAIGPLCAPVARAGGDAVDVLSTVVVDGWTLQPTVRGTRLQQCGSARTSTLPAGAVLGRRYVAWRQGAAVRVRRLADGRTRSYRLTAERPARTQIALSSDSLIVSQAAGPAAVTDATGAPLTRWNVGVVPLDPRR